MGANEEDAIAQVICLKGQTRGLPPTELSMRSTSNICISSNQLDFLAILAIL